MTKFVNLTPHNIDIINNNDEVISIPPSGTIARCTEETEFAWVLRNIKLVYKDYGKVENLPDQTEEDIIYVVSMPVRLALPQRLDIASPGEAVRNSAGNIIGVENLVLNRPK